MSSSSLSATNKTSCVRDKYTAKHSRNSHNLLVKMHHDGDDDDDDDNKKIRITF